jgi:hypothetical protein
MLHLLAGNAARMRNIKIVEGISICGGEHDSKSQCQVNEVGCMAL